MSKKTRFDEEYYISFPYYGNVLDIRKDDLDRVHESAKRTLKLGTKYEIRTKEKNDFDRTAFLYWYTLPYITNEKPCVENEKPEYDEIGGYFLKGRYST